MKIVVTANGADLDAPASPVFGRCPVYVFVDTETMAYEAVENPAEGASSGAGIQAAQFIVERGAQVVVSGNVGPNAFDVLQAAGVAVYLFGGGTVQQAVDAYKAGQLPSAGAPSAPAHTGLGGGPGRGTGMGRGMGRGMGMGRGVTPSAWPAAPPDVPAPETELEELKNMASKLRARMAEVMERLDRLEKGG